MSDSDVHVAALCGSLRAESHTRTALEAVLDAAAGAGATTELLDLREYELPIFDADRDREDAGDAERLAERVRAADTIILGSPMYHAPTPRRSRRRSTTVASTSSQTRPSDCSRSRAGPSPSRP